MPIAVVREHVRQACHREANIFGPSFFQEHLVVVANCASRLAACLEADREVVELAAYLHDLSAVCDPTTMPVHPKASADLAASLLTEQAFPRVTVSRVVDAIAAHSEPLRIGAASPEAVCLSNADAAARILRPAYWLYFAFTVRKQAFADGRQWLRLLLERQWRGLIEPARELIAQQYGTAMGLLSD